MNERFTRPVRVVTWSHALLGGSSRLVSDSDHPHLKAVNGHLEGEPCHYLGDLIANHGYFPHIWVFPKIGMGPPNHPF